MHKTLHLVAGAALASAFGIASAQMTPALPNSPANSSPSSKTDTQTSTSPSGASSSSSTSAGSGDTFAKLDADHDGSVSKKEASSNKSLTAKWDTLDSNKDGKLDQGEFAQFESSTAPLPPKY